ncbi:MAG: hypothetical protein HYU87_01695 [Chloroflexi bacterium]|nr:hypothetical protein [Chloroflexota bacterium]
MLSFLFAIASFSFGSTAGVAFYLVLTVVSAVTVGALMRRDVRRRRAEEALLPPERRPQRRSPRSPITFPIRETSLTFAFWYAATVVIERVLSGGTTVFTLVAIAPFAAFMLTTITIAGRHMAFRLTAEEGTTGNERVEADLQQSPNGRDALP